MNDKPYCPICQGKGFDRPGHICGCISGKYEKRDLPEGFEEIFKGFTKPTVRKNDGR
jgi:hypothetical protein